MNMKFELNPELNDASLEKACDLANALTMRADMIGICVVEGDVLQVLFGDKLVWAGIEVVEPLEDNG